MTIWATCNGQQWIKKIALEPWRVVEAQHVLSTRDLVDTRDEHDMLEEMIDAAKPPVEDDSHYLIFTPFRYPPLKYGSRFGRRFEPSLWYGSLSLKTAFAEVAYYRFQFFNDTAADLGYLTVSMSAFTAFLMTHRGIDLTDQPFDLYTDQISNPSSYVDSQCLGSAMRADGVEAVIYTSARVQDHAKNVAAYTPSVFHRKKNHAIGTLQTWACLARNKSIEFTRMDALGKSCFAFYP